MTTEANKKTSSFVPPPVEGMSLDQLITMLMAARAQGARKVSLARRVDGYGVAAPVDWVSLGPVDGVVYVGILANADSDMSNEALSSLDW